MWGKDRKWRRKIKITVEQDNERMVLEFSSECNQWELAEKFRTIMKFLTWTDGSIDEIINREDE